MKKTALIISVLILICATAAFFFLKKQAPDLEEAKKAEITGNYKEALSAYAEVLLKITPSIELPDVNNSKFMNAPTWKKQVENYASFIMDPSREKSQEFSSLVEDIKRNLALVEQEIRLTEGKTRNLAEVDYIDEWNRAFFANASLVDPSQKSLAAGNRVRNISFVKLAAAKSYTYEITMINLSTAKAIRFKVYPETSTILLGVSGENLLICKSSVSFSPSEMWVSSYNVIPVTIPENASEVSGEFRTSIKKKQ